MKKLRVVTCLDCPLQGYSDKEQRWVCAALEAMDPEAKPALIATGENGRDPRCPLPLAIELPPSGPPEGPRTPLPGVPAETAVISSACRRTHGDIGAVDIALARVKGALLEAMKNWPLEKEATFFVVGSVDRAGRKGLR